ncbi:hypothetical protein Fmac_025990 [Flemingia macrophylla]|uniref:Bifunctional inhibitor/plant lipid transfer protein/seed storage helical domain-containing protein n=1 Tax=Flemingia macrophylla TaxID=520843 RepID=A0ABD1LDL5_9FABA
MAGMKCGRLVCMLVFGLALTMRLAEAQSDTNTSCAQDLIPCANYLSDPNPPSSCCDPLKRTVATQLTCLCNLFNTPGLLSSFNISVADALTLSRRCGVTSDLSSCQNGTAPAPASGAPPVKYVAFTGRIRRDGICLVEKRKKSNHMLLRRSE